MKLTSLQIERFAARSHLQLDGLSDQLNVIYGPNGSGKSTIINFIRWMLYGHLDEAGRRFLVGSDARLGGSFNLIDGNLQPRRMERFHDALRGDQVEVTGREHAGTTPLDPRRLTSVDVNEYGHVFSYGFDQPPSLERLLEVTRTRDFALAYDPGQMERMRSLMARCDALRQSNSTWPGDEALARLLERLRNVQNELPAAESRFAEQLRRRQQEADDLTAEVSADRQHVESLQASLRRTDTLIQTRRNQLQETAYQADQVRQRWLEDRRQEMSEIDYQIQQWHHVLDTIRQRQEALQRRQGITEPESALTTPTDETELRLFLKSLGYQVEDIEQDIREWEGLDDRLEQQNQSEYLRGVLGTALHSLRDDVQRLCRELQRQQVNARYFDHAREQDYLRRCEAELSGLIEALTKRRHVLLASPEFSDVASSDSGYRDPAYLDRSYPNTSHHDSVWRDVPTSGVQINGTPWVRSWYDEASESNGAPHRESDRPLIDPAFEARVSHLLRRRDHLLARIAEMESKIVSGEQRLAHLRASDTHSQEATYLDSLRREIDDVQQRIRQVEERQRHVDEMAALEREIEHLRRNLGPSDILREASAILHRLSGGTYHAVRVNDHHQAQIEDNRGHALTYRELNRGAQDMVYLSMTLALVAAYRRQGVELPMVLNDVFVNIDSERATATAELLTEFAERGHQIILFTRHEHVIRRFASTRAKVYTLRERAGFDATPPSRAPRPAYAPEMPARPPAYYLDQAPVRPVPNSWNSAPSSLPPTPQDRPATWVAHWEPPARDATIDVQQEAIVTPPRYSLVEESLLSDVAWFDRQHVARLDASGVRNIRQFLELAPEEGARILATLSVSASSVHRWQSEVALQCYVGLNAHDAALLVGCGVDDPEELAYIDVSELHRRIEVYLESPDARQRYGSIARFERPRLSRWIQTARRANYRRPTRDTQPAARAPQRAMPPNFRGEVSERVVTRPRRIDPSRTSRVAEAVATDAAPPADASETLRFFLEPSDPIVDAPSIGPKTAERFHAIGVTTVAELLDLDPQDAATRVNYRRITAELIRAWQLQTSLCCRVPNLRGHDAQLLVACDVPGPEQLAKMEAETLFAQVKGLLRTAEGKRILRSAKAPDLTEVTAWIRWSRAARQLQKA